MVAGFQPHVCIDYHILLLRSDYSESLPMHKERRRKSDCMSGEAERKFAVLEIVCKTNMHTNENVDGICAHADPFCPVDAYHYTHILKKELSFYKCIARTFLQQLNEFSLELNQCPCKIGRPLRTKNGSQQQCTSYENGTRGSR